MRYRTGIKKHTLLPVTWAVECPVHAERDIEFPVGQAVSTAKIDFSRNVYYCPAGGGHTFNVEDATAIIFNADGSVAASGVALSDYLF
jgi:hypothetical protein